MFPKICLSICIFSFTCSASVGGFCVIFLREHVQLPNIANSICRSCLQYFYWIGLRIFSCTVLLQHLLCLSCRFFFYPFIFLSFHLYDLIVVGFPDDEMRIFFPVIPLCKSHSISHSLSLFLYFFLILTRNMCLCFFIVIAQCK